MMYYTGTEAHEHLLVVDVEDPSPDQEETQQPLTKFGICDLRKEFDASDPIWDERRDTEGCDYWDHRAEVGVGNRRC